MTDNPFEQLGLRKEILSPLLEQGKLDSFLKDYNRVAQSYLHPDRGGNVQLSSLINSAYTEIKQHPNEVEKWIAEIQDSINNEYQVVMEGLIVEVERLRQVEQNYDELRQQQAPGLVEIVENLSVPPVAKAKIDPVYYGPVPIVLHDLRFGDPTGRHIRYYPIVNLYRGHVDCTFTGSEFMIENPAQLVYYLNCNDRRSYERRIPSLPLWYAIIEKLHTEKNPALESLLKFMPSWIATSTKIDYKHSCITHGVGSDVFDVPTLLPVENMKPNPFNTPIHANNWKKVLKDTFSALKEDYHNPSRPGLGGRGILINDKAWRNVLQALLLPNNLDQAIEVLQTFDSKSSYLWIIPRAQALFPEAFRRVWITHSTGGLCISDF